MRKITITVEEILCYTGRAAGFGCALSGHETTYSFGIPNKSARQNLSGWHSAEIENRHIIPFARCRAQSLDAENIVGAAPRRLFKHEIESYNTRPAVAEQFFLFNAPSPAAVCLSWSFLNCVPSLAKPPLPPPAPYAATNTSFWRVKGWTRKSR